MIKKTQIKWVLVALFFATSIINAQSKKTTMEEQSVVRTIEKMTTAFSYNDVEKIMSCYEPNAVIVFEPESPISDANVLKKMFTEMTKVNPIFTYGEHEVFIKGDIAIHINPWEMTGEAPDGTKIKESGLSLAVLRKQENGEWLMIIDNPHGQFLLNK